MSISGKMSVGVVTMESPPRSRRPWCIETFRSITDSGGECDEPEPLCRQAGCGHALLPDDIGARAHRTPLLKDRKSTRLNSSHLVISYAVFCLKKKKMP